MDIFSKNIATIWNGLSFAPICSKGEWPAAEDWCCLSNSALHLDWWQRTNTFPYYSGSSSAHSTVTRSKELVTALNHYGICVSYNTVKRIDVDLSERIITTSSSCPWSNKSTQWTTLTVMKASYSRYMLHTWYHPIPSELVIFQNVRNESTL